LYPLFRQEIFPTTDRAKEEVMSGQAPVKEAKPETKTTKFIRLILCWAVCGALLFTGVMASIKKMRRLKPSSVRGKCSRSGGGDDCFSGPGRQ
jgi:hypothetical protein